MSLVALAISVVLGFNSSQTGTWYLNQFSSSGFDSLNMRFVGNYPFGPATVVARDSGRSMVFLGSGGGVYILDVSDPTSPTVNGKIATRGWVRGLFYDSMSGRLFVADGKGGLEIWDVTDAVNPQKLGGYYAPEALSVSAAGSYAYVAAGDSGLFVIDVSNPANPQLVTRLRWGTGSSALDVFIRGSHAYVGGRYRLRVLDISDPANPQVVGGYDSDYAILNLYVEGTYAYLARSSGGYLIVDVSDPSNPQSVHSISSHGPAYDVYVSGNYAYGACHDGLMIVDVSDPSNPQQVGFYSTGGDSAVAVSVLGTYAYVVDVDSGLIALDVSNPANPSPVGIFHTPGYAVSVFLSGNYAYVAYTDGINGLGIIDIQNPESPELVGFCQTPRSTEDVFVSGSYAYVVSSIEGLVVIDVSDPANPQEVGTYSPAYYGYYGVFVSGSYAYLISYSRMDIVDVSRPANPQIVGTYYPSASDYLYKVQVVDSLAYVASRFGLRIIDVSNPANPHEIGHYFFSGGALNLHVAGSYAYLACGSRGVKIVDVSDPTNPQEAGSYSPPHYGRFESDVYVSGNYAYFTEAGNSTVPGHSVGVLDVSDPTNPILVGYYNTPSKPRGIQVSGMNVYVATGRSGLQIYEHFPVDVGEDSGYPGRDVKIRTVMVKGGVMFYLDNAQNGRAILRIYDTRGRRTAQTDNPDGFLFKPEKKGVYFYILKTDKAVKRGKLIVF